MFIYHIFADSKAEDDPWYPWYDTLDSAVIVAPNELAARDLIMETGVYGEEVSRNKNCWLSNKYSTCIQIGTASSNFTEETKIIMTIFQAA